MRKLSALLTALILVLALAVPALAAESAITYKGRNKFDFSPGSEYTSSDLFDGFKSVMPGDKRTETITITNETRSCDFIKVYLRAELHHETDNPLSPNVQKTGETVATMSEFLSQLTMTVTNKSKKDAVIFDGKPSELDGLKNRVYLGSIRRGKSITLEAELNVPITLGNAYANREGEVDWVFTVEEYDDKNPDTPKTGDETNILPYVLLFAVGMTGMVILLFSRRRRKN